MLEEHITDVAGLLSHVGGGDGNGDGHAYRLQLIEEGPEVLVIRTLGGEDRRIRAPARLRRGVQQLLGRGLPGHAVDDGRRVGHHDPLPDLPDARSQQATPATGGSLALSGYIQLDHPVNDIQGCDFVNATKLICASDDSSKSLFPDSKPLLEVDLPHALNGADLTGHVTDLGPIPQTNSICSGTFEAEGVDYDVNTGILRVEIIQPSVCEVATTVYEYKAN